MEAITILGSTGSIGCSTLDVIGRHPDRYRVYALTAHSQADLLFSQCLEYSPAYAVLSDEQAAVALQERLREAGCETEVLAGIAALEKVAAAEPVDTVMAAIVGAAGLLPTLAAARAGKKLLLANKESLVMSGSLLMQAVAESGATLLPIDSEHNAIFQCLPEDYNSPARAGIRKILLTASGGPFLDTPLEALARVTPEQACAHPNWSMGAKISVDSATMMNKGLEFIEACLLFAATPAQVSVVIHPQSVVHSMVQYCDGSVLAQLGNPDMRTPIAHALAWPERIESGVDSLDLVQQGSLDFREPDLTRFPCLALAMNAAREGGSAPTILNAANEEAVAAFLARRLPFDRIAQVVEASLSQVERVEPRSIEAVQRADLLARQSAQHIISSMANA